MPTKNGKLTKKELKHSIEADLKNQLISSGNIGKQYDDLILDYMCLYDLKEKLKNDIRKKGLRIESMNGNGFKTEKDNASITNLLKVNTQMLKILADLNLKEPSIPPPRAGDEPDDLLSRN